MTAYELDHLAIAVEAWTQARPALAERLRGRWTAGFRTPQFDPAQIAFAGDMRLELLAPGEADDSFVRRFLLRHGPAAPHHVTFKAHDIHASLAAARAAGLEPIQTRLDDPTWREGFLHPAETGLGFLVQIVQTTHDVADFADGLSSGIEPLWPHPLRPPRAIPAILGTVQDWDRPVDVLTRVLGAEQVELRDDLRRFRWPSGADLLVRRCADRPSGVELLVVADEPRLDLDETDLPATGSTAVLPELGLGIHDLTDRSIRTTRSTTWA